MAISATTSVERKTCVTAPFGAAAAAFLQVFVDVGTQRGKGGSETAEETRHESEEEGKTDDIPVQTYFADAWQALRQQALARPQRDGG